MKIINKKKLCVLSWALLAMTIAFSASAGQAGGVRTSQRVAASAANPGVASTYAAFDRIARTPDFADLIRSGDARGAKAMLVQNGAPASLPLIVLGVNPVSSDPMNQIVPNCTDWGTRTWWQWKFNLLPTDYIPSNIGNGNYGTYITQYVCIQNSAYGSVVWQWQ